MEMKVIKSKRKTMSMEFSKDGQLIIRAPLRIKDGVIEKFLQQKANWIARCQARLQQKDALAKSLQFDRYVYILGEKQPVEEVDIAFSKHASASVICYDNIYKQHANQILPDMAERACQQTGLGYKCLKIGKSTRYWGSYSKDGVMRLNYKLVLMPPNVINYVIIHELCHSKQLNHSPKFWNLVKGFCPNYKTYKAILDKYDFVL